MDKNRLKTMRRQRRRRGIRKRVQGTPEQPRLCVFRSSKHLYAQVVDDLAGRTIVAASTVQEKTDKGCTNESAKLIGQRIAERAKAAGIERVAFDRNGFRFHGRIKTLAEAAREGGLKF